MRCKIVDCALHDDCGFLDIFQKQPESKEGCSYARRNARKKPVSEPIDRTVRRRRPKKEK